MSPLGGCGRGEVSLADDPREELPPAFRGASGRGVLRAPSALGRSKRGVDRVARIAYLLTGFTAERRSA